MAPEFIPFIVCGLLIVASVVACGLLALAAIGAGPLHRGLEPWFPGVARLARPVLVVALVPTLALVAVTAFCAHQVHQQFFLNEPMASAASRGDLDGVRALLDRGASADSWGIDFIQPAIVGAADAGHADVVQLLLERGANPNLKDRRGRSALQLARSGAHGQVVNLLVKAGARE